MMLARHRALTTLLVVSGLALLCSSVALAANDKSNKRDKYAYADARNAPASQTVLNARAAQLADAPPAAAAALKDSLGKEGVVKLDALTGTARYVGRTDGFLTAPSGGSADSIASGYVKANAAALGLDASGVGALKLRQDYVSIDGTHHLSYTQQVNGLTVFGQGVKVNVTKDGRVINVVGSPVGSLSSAPAAEPGLNASQAIAAARAAVGETIVPAASSSGGSAQS